MPDPLLKFGPSKILELFQAFQKAAIGRDCDDIVCAAGNLLVDCIRQEADTGQHAEKYFDAVFGQLKQGLMSHYTSTGRRVEVQRFPSLSPKPLLEIKQ